MSWSIFLSLQRLGKQRDFERGCQPKADGGLAGRFSEWEMKANRMLKPASEGKREKSGEKRGKRGLHISPPAFSGRRLPFGKAFF
jgi:hypothetical protein